MLREHRARLREQRDALVAALRTALPDWTFRIPGGLSLWCELPGPGRGPGIALAEEAERHGVIVAPGPVFAPDGGLTGSSGSPSPAGSTTGAGGGRHRGSLGRGDRPTVDNQPVQWPRDGGVTCRRYCASMMSMTK